MINSVLVTRYYYELKEISDESRKDVAEYEKWARQEEVEAINNPGPLESIFEEVEKRGFEKDIKVLNLDPIMVDDMKKYN